MISPGTHLRRSWKFTVATGKCRCAIWLQLNFAQEIQWAIVALKENKKNKNYSPISSTGKSLSEALIFASTNPQYDDRLFIELQVQYMKISSSNLGRTCCVQKLFLTFRTIFVHNMFSPYSAKRKASDKDLPVLVKKNTGRVHQKNAAFFKKTCFQILLNLILKMA